jgi:hypothetical protein
MITYGSGSDARLNKERDKKKKKKKKAKKEKLKAGKSFLSRTTLKREECKGGDRRSCNETKWIENALGKK